MLPSYTHICIYGAWLISGGWVIPGGWWISTEHSLDGGYPHLGLQFHSFLPFASRLQFSPLDTCPSICLPVIMYICINVFLSNITVHLLKAYCSLKHFYSWKSIRFLFDWTYLNSSSVMGPDGAWNTSRKDQFLHLYISTNFSTRFSLLGQDTSAQKVKKTRQKLHSWNSWTGCLLNNGHVFRKNEFFHNAYVRTLYVSIWTGAYSGFFQGRW